MDGVDKVVSPGKSVVALSANELQSYETKIRKARIL
jgi:hypothetical protein